MEGREGVGRADYNLHRDQSVNSVTYKLYYIDFIY